MSRTGWIAIAAVGIATSLGVARWSSLRERDGIADRTRRRLGQPAVMPTDTDPATVQAS